MKTALACAALVLIVSVFVIGWSNESDETAQPQATESVAPAVTLPTSETVKLAIFERAYSECASTKIDLLAAKYKAAKKTKPIVATVVARGWVKYYEGGEDAVSEGRAGCLQGFKDEAK
jgi:hypothetical protein